MLRSLWIALALMFMANGAQAQSSAVCSNISIPLEISTGYAPFARLHLGDRDGRFLIDTGATDSAVDAGFFGLKPGTETMLDHLSFPTTASAKFRVVDFSGNAAARGGFNGLIGTDLLSGRVVTFRYGAAAPELLVATAPCPAPLVQAGFMPVSLSNYRGADADGIRSLWSGHPTIFIRIGPLAAAIGIDTGHYEIAPRLGPSPLLVNEALFQRLRAAGVAMQRDHTVESVNCWGEVSRRLTWRIEDVPLRFTDEAGRELFRYEPPRLEVFATDSVCGTIETSPVPFGLAGAAYLKLWGELVFDPKNQRIFVAPQQALPIYKVMALAWNRSGSWVLESDESVDKASASALAKCNAQSGNCTLAPMSSDPRSYQCLGIASQAEHRDQLSLVKGSALSETRREAVETCVKTYGGACKLEYAVCNG